MTRPCRSRECDGDPEMQRARYTQIVGKWQVRAVSTLVVAVLGGEPAVAIACHALCSDRPHATVPTEASERPSHHHDAAAQEPQQSASHAGLGAENLAASHDHGQSAATMGATLHEPQKLWSGTAERYCCTSLGRPRARVTAARAHSSLLPTPQGAVLQAGVLLDCFDRRPGGPTHGPPPGELSPSRTPLVLRI